MKKSKLKKLYEPLELRVLELKAQEVICASRTDYDGDDSWTDEPSTVGGGRNNYEEQSW